MKRYTGISILVFAGLSLASNARAANHAQMTNYFTQKIKQVNSVMGQETQKSSNGGTWLLREINFDLAPSVTFGVSKVLDITVAPEIDFVLTLEE